MKFARNKYIYHEAHTVAQKYVLDKVIKVHDAKYGRHGRALRDIAKRLKHKDIKSINRQEISSSPKR